MVIANWFGGILASVLVGGLLLLFVFPAVAAVPKDDIWEDYKDFLKVNGLRDSLESQNDFINWAAEHEEELNYTK